MAAVEKRKTGAPKGSNLGNTYGAASAGKPRAQLTRNKALTKQIGRMICDEVAKGTPKQHACLAAGISVNTAQEWVRRGEGGDAAKNRPATPLTTWFAQEWRKAESLDVIRRRKRLEVHAETDPRVDMWWLERRHPEEFGRVDRMEVTGDGGGPVTIRLAFDPTPIPARTRGELGGPVIDVDAEELA